MGWKLGVPARAFALSLRLAGVHMAVGVWTDCAVQSRASQHRTQTGESIVLRGYMYRCMWCTSTPYVGFGSSCSHRAVIIDSLLVGGSTCAGRAAATAATQQQPTRARSVRACPCLCAGAEGSDHSLDQLSHISCWAKQKTAERASHSSGASLPHRPAGYSAARTSLRTPLALPFGAAEKGSEW